MSIELFYIRHFLVLLDIFNIQNTKFWLEPFTIDVEFEVNGFHIEIYPLMSVVQIKDICIKYLIYYLNL